MVCAALYQMLKPIVDAHHLETGVDGLYSDGAYDAVYAGRGPASHQNTKSIGSHHLTASFISALLKNRNKGNSDPEKLRDEVTPFNIIHHMVPRYARHYVLSSGPDSSLQRPLCHQPSLDSSRRLNPIALAPRQAEVSQVLHLPALLQGAGERSSLGRARWEARRGTATEKRGAGSDNRTAKRAQQGHQGAVGASIRSLDRLGLEALRLCLLQTGTRFHLRLDFQDGCFTLRFVLDLHSGPPEPRWVKALHEQVRGKLDDHGSGWPASLLQIRQQETHPRSNHG